MGFESDNPQCGIKMYGSVVVGSKGQVVIPKDVREELGISSGDTMMVLTKHGRAIGMIKSSDLEEFMAYMKQEMELLKSFTSKDTQNS